ncbi:hypothetical protein [Hymenobacter sp.]|uniref:hypothetical protein n=1 Tax=Hymenobacter sp. TaxID=1898978 RepID=UPI00286A636F|nr:hypothetical protein [Hymenobacter sp.]
MNPQLVEFPIETTRNELDEPLKHSASVTFPILAESLAEGEEYIADGARMTDQLLTQD